MDGFNGGIEEYGDSMATHYLLEDPTYNRVRTFTYDSGKTRELVLPSGKLTPEYTEPTDLRIPEGALITERPAWSRYRERDEQQKELSLRRANATSAVGAAPNLEKPLSPEKRAKIPIDVSPEQKNKIITEDIQRDALNLVSINENEPIKMSKMVTGDVKGYYTGIKDVQPPQRPIISEKRVGQILWKRRERAAWGELRQPFEIGGGVQTGAVALPSGELVSITSKKAQGTDRGSAPRVAMPRGSEIPVGIKHLSSNPPPQEVATSIMPGYDPTGEKGLYPGKRGQRTAGKTVDVLKGMPVEEALRMGMGIEQAALTQGRGNAPVLRESLRAGEGHLESIAASRRVAEAARQRGIQQMQEMTARVARNRELLDNATILRGTKDVTIQQQADAEVEAEVKTTANPRRSRKTK